MVESGSSSSVATTNGHQQCAVLSSIIGVYNIGLLSSNGHNLSQNFKGALPWSVNLEDKPGVHTRIIDSGEKDSSDPAFRS